MENGEKILTDILSKALVTRETVMKLPVYTWENTSYLGWQLHPKECKSKCGLFFKIAHSNTSKPCNTDTLCLVNDNI